MNLTLIFQLEGEMQIRLRNDCSREVTELHDLKQVIESPTRVTEHSESLID